MISKNLHHRPPPLIDKATLTFLLKFSESLKVKKKLFLAKLLNPEKRILGRQKGLFFLVKFNLHLCLYFLFVYSAKIKPIIGHLINWNKIIEK